MSVGTPVIPNQKLETSQRIFENSKIFGGQVTHAYVFDVQNETIFITNDENFCKYELNETSDRQFCEESSWTKPTTVPELIEPYPSKYLFDGQS